MVQLWGLKRRVKKIEKKEKPPTLRMLNNQVRKYRKAVLEGNMQKRIHHALVIIEFETKLQVPRAFGFEEEISFLTKRHNVLLK